MQSKARTYQQHRAPSQAKQCITTGSCGHRGERTMFPDTFVAGAAHPERYVLKKPN